VIENVHLDTLISRFAYESFQATSGTDTALRERCHLGLWQILQNRGSRWISHTGLHKCRRVLATLHPGGWAHGITRPTIACCPDLDTFDYRPAHAARVVLFSVVYVCDFVCLTVNMITPE